MDVASLMKGKRPGIAAVVLRAARRRCPHCGRGRVFDSWFAMRSTCPACGLRLERNEQADYWVGGYLVNFIVAELIVVFVMTLAVVALWPDVPWAGVLYGTAAAAILGPLLTFPFSKVIWLGLDLVFRPAEESDFQQTAEPLGR